MRVISGIAKGRKLSAVPGEEIRPTIDRVKEGMFSSIQFDIPGSRVLDLFAGTGQLGIEALSRGASICTFVDNSKKSQQVQKQNIETTGFTARSRLVLADGISFLLGTKDMYDIIILDPPYQSPLMLQSLKQASNVMTASSIVICEHSTNLLLQDNINALKLQKQYRYGKTLITTYRLKES